MMIQDEKGYNKDGKGRKRAKTSKEDNKDEKNEEYSRNEKLKHSNAEKQKH